MSLAVQQSWRSVLQKTGVCHTLSPQAKKIAAVAVASLIFFHVQWGLSLKSSIALTLLCCTLTHLSKRYLSHHTEINWFNTEFRKKALVFWSVVFLLQPLFWHILFLPTVRSRKAQHPPVLMDFPPLKLFIVPSIKSVIVGPIIEEILCRGWLLERLEETVFLISRHIVQVPKQKQAKIANSIQALIFALGHWNNNNFRFFLLPKLATGYLLARMKNQHETLIISMVAHSMLNFSVITQAIFTMTRFYQESVLR